MSFTVRNAPMLTLVINAGELACGQQTLTGSAVRAHQVAIKVRVQAARYCSRSDRLSWRCFIVKHPIGQRPARLHGLRHGQVPCGMLYRAAVVGCGVCTGQKISPPSGSWDAAKFVWSINTDPLANSYAVSAGHLQEGNMHAL